MGFMSALDVLPHYIDMTTSLRVDADGLLSLTRFQERSVDTKTEVSVESEPKSPAPIVAVIWGTSSRAKGMATQLMKDIA